MARMLRHSLLLLTLTLPCASCTSLAVKRHAFNEQLTSTDIRYQEVLDNLARIAHDPFALPAYSSIYAGLAQITDTTQLVSTTTLGTPNGMQAITPQFTRAEFANCTLDPINAPEKIEAMRAACQWVIYGPQFAFAHDPGRILANPQEAPIRGRHFGVADGLAKLPPHWLYVSRTENVPACAKYSAEYCGTRVWVTPEGIRGLADFTLILQYIARIDINAQTLQYIRPTPSSLAFLTNSLSCIPPEIQQTPSDAIPPYASGHPMHVLAQVSVDPSGNLVPDAPSYRPRVENLGSDANVRSQINAAGLH